MLVYNNLGSIVTKYDILLGVEQTIKFLARYGLLANTLLCPQCHAQNAALVKYSSSPEGFIVCDILKIPKLISKYFSGDVIDVELQESEKLHRAFQFV